MKRLSFLFRRCQRVRPFDAQMKKRAHSPLLKNKSLILALTSSLGFLLSLHAGLFVVLSFADFLNDSIARCLPLEPSQGAIQGFIFFYFDLAHL